MKKDIPFFSRVVLPIVTATAIGFCGLSYGAMRLSNGRSEESIPDCSFNGRLPDRVATPEEQAQYLRQIMQTIRQDRLLKHFSSLSINFNLIDGAPYWIDSNIKREEGDMFSAHLPSRIAPHISEWPSDHSFYVPTETRRATNFDEAFDIITTYHEGIGSPAFEVIATFDDQALEKIIILEGGMNRFTDNFVDFAISKSQVGFNRSSLENGTLGLSLSVMFSTVKMYDSDQPALVPQDVALSGVFHASNGNSQIEITNALARYGFGTQWGAVAIHEDDSSNYYDKGYRISELPQPLQDFYLMVSGAEEGVKTYLSTLCPSNGKLT